MNATSKIIISSLTWSAMLINQVQAYLPRITFEQPGYAPGSTVGLAPGSGWSLISGNASISPIGTGSSGGQALKLQANPQQEPLLKREVIWDISQKVAFIDLKIKPAADPQGSPASFFVNGAQLAFQVPTGSNTGGIWVYNGGAGIANPAQWAKTVGTFTLNGNGLTASDYTRITLRHDYQRNLWDLFINSKLAAANLAFEGRGANLQNIELYGSKVADTLIDDLSADPSNMLFPDADKDGLPDAWETANGSNPNLYDRDALKPGTNTSFLDLYLNSLWSGGLNASNPLPAQGSIPPLTILGNHQPVGSMKGSFSVSGDGSANYSIPIEIPKGTAGMEPKISLSYSSGSGNGIVGLGFALSGLQVITRGLATFRKDGVSGAIGQQQDRFFLNGERLVCVSGSYGSAGSEYRTEIDSFARIILISSAQSGISSWRVETKAGLIIDFGTTADSRILSSGLVPLSWFVKKVSDTVGNYYLVTYESESSEDPIEIRNHRVKNIKYTGNTASGLAPYSTIAFSYEARPDIVSSYTRGSKFTTSCRLSGLEVSTGETVNHRYELDYQVSPQTSRSILTQIQRFQSGGESLPPTLIQWNQVSDTGVRTKWRDSVNGEENFMQWDSGLTSYSKFIDMNGDGLLDRADHHNYVTGVHGLWLSLNTGTGFLPRTKWYDGGAEHQNCPEWYNSDDRLSGLLDMNADGLPDRVDHYNFQTQQYGLWVSINTGSGFAAKSRWYSSIKEEQCYLEWENHSSLIDLNGDGRPDKVDHHNYETNQPGIWVSLNTGSGFASKSRWYLSTSTNQNLMKWANGNTIYSGFFDVNGDGRPDRVDHYDYATNTHGIWVSLNTGTSFALKTRWYTSSQGEQCRPESYESGHRNSGFTDMNGDGLPDRVDHYNYESNLPGLWVSLNTGSGFAPRTRWYLGSHVDQNLPIWSANEGTNSMLLDVNGDGLPDKLDHYDYITSEGGLWVSLNTGNGFAAKSLWYQGTYSGQDQPLWKADDNSFSDFVDMNGDGLPDRVDHRDYITGVPGLWVSLNNGNGFSEKTKWYDSPSKNQCIPQWGVYSGFIDLNSDGLPDRLDHHNYQTGQFGFWISLNKGNGFNEFSSMSYGPEVISAVTDGFGSKLNVKYRRLNDPTPTTAFGSRVFEKSTGTLPTGHVPIIASRLVVSRYSEPDGKGGQHWKSQRYGDLRFDRNNEASLGFGWIEAFDESNGQLTRTDFRRDFPFAGSPSSSWTKVNLTAADLAAMPPNEFGYPTLTTGKKMLTMETAAYEEMASQTGVGGTIRRPVQTVSVKHLFDLDGTLKGETVTTQLLADFDAYGFVKKSNATSLDGFSVQTTNTYTHNTTGGKWHLGRLTHASVSKGYNFLDERTKNSSFAYSAATGLLTSETIEQGTPHAITTAYTHDGFGNAVMTSVTARPDSDLVGTQTRSSATVFDSRGRFVTAESNSVGTVQFQYNTQKALLNSTTDINGLTTFFTYDPFGTLILTHHPDGTKTGEITGYAVNASLPPSVAAHVTNPIRFFRAKQSSGAPAGKVYLDAQGREIITETIILKNAGSVGAARYRTVYAVTKYDLFGRKTAVSESFDAAETPLYTTINYDILSRAIKTIHPDGSWSGVVSQGAGIFTSHLGPVSTATYTKSRNQAGQILERWEDEHGRLAQSKDPSGQITTFAYDVESRLKNAIIGNSSLLSNIYDPIGNKIGVFEANSGYTQSQYNGFGELVRTYSARGAVTTFTYDSAGRPLTVIKPEGTYITVYTMVSGSTLGKPLSITGSGAAAGYKETFSYDTLGRPTSTSKTQFGETFTTSTVYDALGRVASSTDAGGLTVLNEYDPTYSFPLKRKLAPGTYEGAGTVLWQAGAFDSKGRALTQTLAQGVTTTLAYHPTRGDLTALSSSWSGGTLQNKTYLWDGLGNLTSRTDLIAGRLESFGYDYLNRLASSSVSSLAGATTSTVPPPQSYSYSTNGNLLTKGTSASLAYNHPTRIHAVTSATVKGASRSYSYDKAGYVTSDSKRTYQWTSFGQLQQLDYLATTDLRDFSGNLVHAASRVTSTFDFDAGGNRARQTKERIAANDSRKIEFTLYLGSYEREVHQTKASSIAPAVLAKTVHRHSLGGGVIYTRTTGGTAPGVKLLNVLADHLGSTDVILAGKWNGSSFANHTTERQSYDAWGERRAANTQVNFRATDADPFRTSSQDYDRGYTGHEQMDDSGLIHMNGRIYDPELGRFLSPDPYVQIPEYSQNFNRYSYVLNNPLNATDPSGFSFLSRLFGKIGDFIKENWRTIVSIVVAVALAFVLTPFGGYGLNLLRNTFGITGGFAQGAIVGSAAGGSNSAINGGDLGDVLRGAAVGGLQGGISGSLLHGWESNGWNLETLRHVAGHGIVGGAANAAMGGKFQDGFISAAVSAGAGDLGFTGGSNPLFRTIKSGIIGGTASVLGGGKFANGAYTSAFQHLLNQELPEAAKKVYALATKGTDEAAFYDRALVGAGGHNRALRVSSGKEIIDWFKKFTNTDQVDIHSHGYDAGVIGAGDNNGLYQHRFQGDGGSATASQLAAAIASNTGGFKKNAVIRFFGCNCTAVASEVAWNLVKYKRTDITIIGANGSVSPIRHGSQHGFQPGNRSFVLKGGSFNHYRGNNFVGDSKVLEW